MTTLSKLTMKVATEGGGKVKQDLAKLDRQLDKTAKASQKAFDGKKVGEWAAGVAKGVAAMASVQAVMSSIERITERTRLLGEASRTFDIPIEQLSIMEFQARRTGVEIDDLVTAISDLNERAKSGSNDYATEFAKIGVEMDKIKDLSAEEIFAKFAEGIRNTSDASVTAAVGSELLGDNYQRLFPFIRLTTEELAKFEDKARETNSVITEETIEANKEYTQSIKDLQDSWDGLIKSFSEIGALKGVATALDGISKRLQTLSTAAKDVGGAMGLSQSGDLGAAIEFGQTHGFGLMALPALLNGERPWDTSVPVVEAGRFGGEPSGPLNRDYGWKLPPKARTSGLFDGVPWNPDLLDRDTDLNGNPRLGYLGGVTEDEMDLRDFMKDQTEELKEALESVAALPESQMWSNIIEDLRAGNAILQSIDGALQIISKKPPVEIGRVS